MNEHNDAVDNAIFTGRVLIAVKTVCDATGCGIHAAIDAIAKRHDQLRAERPDEFTVPREEWGRNFYS